MKPEFFEEKNLKLQDKIYTFAENHSKGKLGHVVVAPLTEVGSALLDVSTGCAKAAESVTCVAVNLLKSPFSSTARGDIKESFKGIFTGLYQGTLGAIPRVGRLFKNVVLDIWENRSLKTRLEDRHKSEQAKLKDLKCKKYINYMERHPDKADDTFFITISEDTSYDSYLKNANIPWEKISNDQLDKWCGSPPRSSLISIIGKKAPERVMQYLNVNVPNEKKDLAHWWLFNALPTEKKVDLNDSAKVPPGIIEYIFENNAPEATNGSRDIQNQLMNKWAEDVRDGRYPPTLSFWKSLPNFGTDKFEEWDTLPWDNLKERINKGDHDGNRLSTRYRMPKHKNRFAQRLN